MWTLLEDDNGGGYSYTGYYRILIESDKKDLEHIVLKRCNCSLDTKSNEYGDVFTVKSSPSISELLSFPQMQWIQDQSNRRGYRKIDGTLKKEYNVWYSGLIYEQWSKRGYLDHCMGSDLWYERAKQWYEISRKHQLLIPEFIYEKMQFGGACPEDRDEKILFKPLELLGLELLEVWVKHYEVEKIEEWAKRMQKFASWIEDRKNKKELFCLQDGFVNMEKPEFDICRSTPTLVVKPRVWAKTNPQSVKKDQLCADDYGYEKMDSDVLRSYSAYIINPNHMENILRAMSHKNCSDITIKNNLILGVEAWAGLKPRLLESEIKRVLSVDTGGQQMVFKELLAIIEKKYFGKSIPEIELKNPTSARFKRI